jgi:fumarate reductase flavoprotein subunit
VAIIVDPQARFAHTAAVVVVGAGAAGAMAALAARSQGAAVLLLERDASPTGATASSSGMIPAAGTQVQAQHGIEDTPELFANDIQAKANGSANDGLLATYTERSAAVLDWLAERHHFKFELVEGTPPGHSRRRMHSLAERGGTALLSALYSALGGSGAKVQPGVRVTALIVDNEQRLLGLRYRRANGSDGQIGCSALVLACSGFAGNAALVEQYLPDVRALPFAGHAGSQGDALQWGLQMGAAVADIDGFIAHGAVVMPQKLALPWSLMTEGAVQVNRDGERFVNEHEGYSESALFVLAQPGQLAYNIYDERVHEVGLTMPNYPAAVASGVVKRAAGLRELADLLGIRREGLEETIALVNALALDEDVDDFGRRFFGRQMLLGPYYGVPVTGALLDTEGGLAINSDGRVLRDGGDAFPNLLAAGAAARGVSGDGGGGYLEGNGLLTALVGGYLAGRTAGELVG